jgi:hypothetical protein
VKAQTALTSATRTSRSRPPSEAERCTRSSSQRRTRGRQVKPSGPQRLRRGPRHSSQAALSGLSLLLRYSSSGLPTREAAQR